MGILKLIIIRENWFVFGLKELLIGDRLVKFGQSSIDLICVFVEQVRLLVNMKYGK